MVYKNKAKQKEYNSKPENKARAKEYYSRPEVKARKKELAQRPENIAKRKEYSDRPEIKARREEYTNKLEVKAKRKEWSERPEVKARRKERKDRPENKAKAQKKNIEIYIILTKEKLKYGKMCTCCGLTDIHNLTRDHITPSSKGGTNTPDNIQLLCWACNGSKGDRLKCTLPHDNPEIKKMVRKSRKRKSKK